MNASGVEQIFRLPDLGEGLTEAEILEWRVAVGDTVTVDQAVVEVETAKAAVDVPIPIAGTVVRLYGEPGSVIEVGRPLIAVAVPDERYREEERAGSGNVLVGYGTGGTRRSRRRAARLAKAAAVAAGTSAAEAVSTPVPAAEPVATPVAEPVAAPAAEAPVRPVGEPKPIGRVGSPVRTEAPRVISPVVRRLARTHAIDLAALTPSGVGGVVLRRDVDAAIAAVPGIASTARAAAHATTAVADAADRGPVAPAPAEAVGATPDPVDAAVPDAATPDPADRAEPIRIPIRGLRRTVAEKLSRSRREIPDATTWVDVDATALMELKAGIDRAAPESRVGMLAFFARICVAGLRRFPELNAYVDTERDEIVRLPRIHLGFAAQTDRGLVVPVVHDAHRLTLTELAARLRERTEAAREDRLTPRQLTGGTFTLNNYGVFGVDGSTPIINHPEAAILGIGRITGRPWAFEGELRLRKVTQLSFTFDHRVCDGGVAGGFLRFIADCVERPEVLIANL